MTVEDDLDAIVAAAKSGDEAHLRSVARSLLAEAWDYGDGLGWSSNPYRFGDDALDPEEDA